MSIFNKDKNFKKADIAEASASTSGQRAKYIGSYSFATGIIILAILVVINVIFAALPENLTQLDISSSKLYSLSANSKAVVNNLKKDVEIYYICQSGEEDTVIEKLLGKYEAQSDHITVTQKNPDIYPTFAQQYTDDTVQNSDVVVVSGDKYRYISVDDIYVIDEMEYYYTGSTTEDFDGEGQITSAINYVVSDELPKLYVLTGHNEEELSNTATKLFERSNIEIDSLSLLKEDIPEDAEGVMIYAPETDISEQEVSILEDYADNGGKLIVISGPVEGGELENLNSLMSYAGIQIQEGIVIESDETRYAYSTPYAILPELTGVVEAESLDDNSNIIAGIASGAFISDDNELYTAQSILDTGDDSYSKIAGYDIDTYDFEEGDIDGPFSVAAISENINSGGEIIWIGTSLFLDDYYNSYSSEANSMFFSDIMSGIIENENSVSIAAKSMSYDYLTFTDSAASLLKNIMVIFIPLAFLLVGIVSVVIRRRMH